MRFLTILIVFLIFFKSKDIINILNSDNESPSVKLNEKEEEIDLLNLIKNNFHNNKSLVEGKLDNNNINNMIKIINERRKSLLDNGLIKIKKDIRLKDLLYSFIIVIIVFTIVLILYNLKNKLTEIFEENLFNTFSEITKDFLFIYFTFSWFFIFFNLFDDNLLSYILYTENVLIYFLILIIFWVIICLIKLCFIQKYCTNLGKIENIISNKTEFMKKIYEDDNFKSKKKVLNMINFIIMRDNFINSYYIPPVKEYLLRNDFNFSYYLTLYSAKVIKSFFAFNTLSYLSFILGLVVSFFITKIFYIFIVLIVNILIILAIVIFIYRLKSKFIYYNKNLDVLKFIREGIVPKDFELNFYPPFLKLKNNNYSYKSNKQEKFFWLDSPKFLIKLIQFLEIYSLNIIFFNINLFKTTLKHNKVMFYVFLCLIIAAFILIMVMVIYFLDSYIILTHGSFMKDYKIIDETLNIQRNSMVKIYKDCFKAIKFILRENIIKNENKKIISFDNILTKQIYEISEIFIKNKNNRITINNIMEIAYLLGYKLNQFEWESICEFCLINLNELETSNNPLDFNKFINHIEFTMDECKRDPYKILQSFLKYNSLVNQNNIDLNKLKNILIHRSLLSKKSIEILFFDLSQLSNKELQIDEERFLNYFRNMIGKYEY